MAFEPIHFIERCRRCSCIVNQCRCPAKDKEVRLVLCAYCSKKMPTKNELINMSLPKPTNDAPPLTAEEIAELRDCLERGANGMIRGQDGILANFDRLVAERNEARRIVAEQRDRLLMDPRGRVTVEPLSTIREHAALLAENAQLKAAVELLDDYDDGFCFVNGGVIYINLSDTFAYACADGEPVPLEYAAEVNEIRKRDGFAGVLRWVIARREGGDWPNVPIPPVKKWMEENDALREEVTKLKAQVERVEKQYSDAGDEAFKLAARQSARIEELEAQVEQLKADGERPLRDTGILKSAMESVLVSEEWSKELRGFGHGFIAGLAAIDLARKAKWE